VKRLPYIDWTRGAAVVAMVLWHTGDAWLRPGLKAGQGFLLLRFVGGLAAPTFLFLAGLGASLASKPAPTDAPQNAVSRGLGRGLEIVMLGYALRLQSWLVDAQALTSLRAAGAYLPLGLGYAGLFLTADAMARGARVKWPSTAASVALVVLGLAQVPTIAPGRFLRLLQIDVLQCIGFSLCLLAVLDRAASILRAPRRAVALGCLVACGTEPLAELLPGAIPTPLAAMIARLPLQDGVQPALFPLFPWFAYACFGAAMGGVLRGSRVPEAVGLRCATFGAFLAVFTSEALPFIHRTIGRFPFAVGPIRTGFRTGIVLVLIAVGIAWVDGSGGRSAIRLGQHSLRIYWAHMLFAYGVLGRPLQHKLGYPAWLGMAGLLLILMWLVARIGGVLPGGPALPKIRLEPKRG
jgi:uncharacterized membrane protein